MKDRRGAAVAKLARWHLYIDESGHFDDPQAHAIVAGVLLADEVVPSDAALRRTLEDAVPGFPWPWHTTWINAPMWVALATLRAAADARAAERIGPQVLRAATEAVEFVNAFAPAELQAVRARLEAGEEPKAYRAHLDQWWARVCSGRRACVAPLEQQVQLPIVALQRLFEPLAARCEPGERPPVTVFAAGEVVTGDAADQAGTLAVGDRYLNLLAVLAQRAAAAVSLHGGRHQVDLHVLERDVRYAQLGVMRPLKPAALSTVVGAIRPVLPEGVTVAAYEVVPFRGNVSPRFVLADFVANRMRRALRRTQEALSQVEGRCSAECGLDLRRFSARSHLAASGEAYRLVATGAPDASTAKALLPVTPVRRRWACEQAWEWAVAR